MRLSSAVSIFVRVLPLRTIVVAVAVLAMWGGCARYEAKPLNDENVERELATPDAQTLQMQASQLHNPMLRPVDVDLSRGLSPDEAAVVAVIANPQLRAER